MGRRVLGRLVVRAGKATGFISLEIDGEEQVKFAVGRMQHAFEDLRPVWDAMRDAFHEVELEQFATGGAAGKSGGWEELSPDYAAWKAKHYPGRGVLVRSGALRDALVGGPASIYEPHPTWMGVGADVPYGIFHQRGQGVPVRKPIDVNSVRESGVFARAVGEVARELGKQWSGNSHRPFALS